MLLMSGGNGSGMIDNSLRHNDLRPAFLTPVGWVMHYKKLVSTLVGVAACAAMTVTDASAQPSRGGGRFHGGRAIGHATPRVVAARTFGPRTRGFYPYRSYYSHRSYYR